MIFMCSDCGYEFEGDSNTEKCPTCGAGKDGFIIQPYNVMSEFETYTVNEED